MLQSLHLKRFQAHDDFFIEFDPFITVITGQTDAGKSSILRALQWTCLNRPSGDSFIRNKQGTAEAILQVDDRTITRKRGKGINFYQLDDKEFEAFGIGTVPDEIASFLNLSEASFQNQLDAHFWLSQTPGQVSKELNSVINLGMIDKTMAWLSSETRKAKSVVNVSESRLKSSRERRDDLVWIQDADAALAILERLEADLEACRQKRIDLESILSKMAEQEKVCKNRIPAEKVDAIDELCVKIEETRERRQRLEELLQEIQETQEVVESCRVEKLAAEVSLKKMMKGRCPVCSGVMK